MKRARARGCRADDLVHAWHQVRNVETGTSGSGLGDEGESLLVKYLERGLSGAFVLEG